MSVLALVFYGGAAEGVAEGYYFDSAEDSGGYDRVSPVGPYDDSAAALRDARAIYKGGEIKVQISPPDYYPARWDGIEEPPASIRVDPSPDSLSHGEVFYISSGADGRRYPGLIDGDGGPPEVGYYLAAKPRSVDGAFGPYRSESHARQEIADLSR